MNRHFSTIIPAAILIAFAGISTLQAQEGEVAVVPFSFHVDSQTLPAGKYQVKQFESGGHLPIFTISGDNRHSIMVGMWKQGTADPENPKLTFTCLGKDCSLTQVDLPGSTVSYGRDTHRSNYHVGMAASVVAVRISR